jgi:hypothetical protein
MIISEIIELQEQLREAKEMLQIAKHSFEFEEQKILEEKISIIKSELQRHLIIK